MHGRATADPAHTPAPPPKNFRASTAHDSAYPNYGSTTHQQPRDSAIVHVRVCLLGWRAETLAASTKMVLSTYKPGTLCWAKLKGYPWWPSRIENEGGLTKEVVDSKPRNGRVYPVLFFGSLDYAWITPENLDPYEENITKHGSKGKNRKDPSFADALKQAQDPSIVDEIIKRGAEGAEASDEEKEEDEEEEEEDEKEERDADNDVEMQSSESESSQIPQTKKQSRVKAKNGRSKQATTGRKRMSLSSNSSGDGTVPETTPKRSRTTAKEESIPKSGSPNGSARQDRDSDDVQSTTRESPRSGSPRGDEKSSRGVKSHQSIKNPSKTYQFLMQLRHRLQKMLIKGPAPDDLSPVHEVLRKLEDFDMTLELIQDTKLGKVMRIIAGSEQLKNAPEEQFDIKGRADRLAEKWRQLILKLREGSVESVAPESPVLKTANPIGKKEETRAKEATPNSEDVVSSNDVHDKQTEKHDDVVTDSLARTSTGDAVASAVLTEVSAENTNGIDYSAPVQGTENHSTVASASVVDAVSEQ
ncbi:hypothetical protein COEREDRAFT_7007 [Coemansia reversa NRRL 1564]|uniref:PWWP domain-containing protein n=1 Tax=Coemansia reversa (strain ATCC 12441 / NRRL 1564) TaxID=763665 RepID=A0A2G5BFM8_COERN|nr:hypothetical protein COEREDRAFT_7007 [Coemansia reversa NRRL 1564]|eukprot:PIA17810.1 hypothetical protein COEREDRAFT_7007 [Coemansia reversa NRRL 1564]